jgi:hypothetical protein
LDQNKWEIKKTIEECRQQINAEYAKDFPNPFKVGYYLANIEWLQDELKESLISGYVVRDNSGKLLPNPKFDPTK